MGAEIVYADAQVSGSITTPANAVTDLVAVTGGAAGEVVLTWSAPA